MRFPRTLAVTILPALFASSSCAPEQIDVIENATPVAVPVGGGNYARGALIGFDGSASTDTDGTITSFAWDFGDGQTGSGALAEHIYNAAGVFDVELSVTDDDGAVGSAAVQVRIDDNAAPIAVIDAPLQVAVGTSARFDGTASNDSDGTVTSFTWDFGDGTDGTGPLFDKMFDTAGAFTVMLTVTDDDGAAGTAQHTIQVAEPPEGFDGQWSWFLTDESLRDLGLWCGTFQDSQLTILTNGGDITITEHAGGVDVPYSGTLATTQFNVSNSQLGITQSIAGTFTSPSAFVGTYSVTGLSDCADRPVEGTKNP